MTREQEMYKPNESSLITNNNNRRKRIDNTYLPEQLIFYILSCHVVGEMFVNYDQFRKKKKSVSYPLLVSEYD